MKQINFIFILTIFSVTCQAQPADTLTLSRDAAIRLGLKNRYDIKANAYDLQVKDRRIQNAKDHWLPEINGDAQVRYSPQIQQSVIPGGVFPGFEAPTKLPLTVKNQSIFGLNLSQPVFDANLSNDLRIAKNNLLQQREINRAAEIDIMFSISRAYLDAQLRNLQKRIAADIAHRNQEYEKIAAGMLKAGSLIENHYLRAKLDLENADQLAKQAEQTYQLSLLRLCYQLNIPENSNLKLTDAMEQISEDAPQGDQQGTSRSEIRQLEIAGKAEELNLKKARQSVLPSLYFTANYSQQFLSEDFRYGAQRWWSPFSYVAVNLRIPISAHYKNKSMISEYQDRINQNTLLLEQKKADIRYEVQQARISLANAILNIKTAKDSYELAGTIYRNQQQQYQLGAFDYTQLLDTEKSLSETERVYIQSVYELMLAQLQLQKATNNFKL